MRRLNNVYSWILKSYKARKDVISSSIKEITLSFSICGVAPGYMAVILIWQRDSVQSVIEECSFAWKVAELILNKAWPALTTEPWVNNPAHLRTNFCNFIGLNTRRQAFTEIHALRLYFENTHLRRSTFRCFLLCFLDLWQAAKPIQIYSNKSKGKNTRLSMRKAPTIIILFV